MVDLLAFASITQLKCGDLPPRYAPSDHLDKTPPISAANSLGLVRNLRHEANQKELTSSAVARGSQCRAKPKR
jgi:hypothetical protein